LIVQCVGTVAGIDPFGARVRVDVGGRALSGEVQAASGYISQGDPRVHFGLGDDGAYARIEIRWPTGERERFPGGKANQVVVLKQGAGERVAG
jgi:enediyne biosynthesis protein E4